VHDINKDQSSTPPPTHTHTQTNHSVNFIKAQSVLIGIIAVSTMKDNKFGS